MCTQIFQMVDFCNEHTDIFDTFKFFMLSFKLSSVFKNSRFITLVYSKPESIHWFCQVFQPRGKRNSGWKYFRQNAKIIQQCKINNLKKLLLNSFFFIFKGCQYSFCILLKLFLFPFGLLGDWHRSLSWGPWTCQAGALPLEPIPIPL
jgi:hypothetical protein